MTDTRKEFEEWHECRRLKILELQKEKVECLLKDMNRDKETFETTSPSIRQDALFLALREIDTSELSVWQACQQLNDKRIEQLLAVIAKKNEALTSAMEICDAVPNKAQHSVDPVQARIGKLVNQSAGCRGDYAAIRDALALQPSDVELADIGYISEDGEEVFLTMGLPLDAETCGVPVTKLYTIKTKANTK